MPKPVDETDWLDLLNLIPKFDPLAQSEGYDFDPERAWRVVEFFQRHLTHVKGEKALEPFMLEPWQCAVLCNVYGWVNPHGVRRFRELGMWVPRKNGKTPLVAGMCLYALCMDGERGAEVIGAASDRDQASLMFQHADGMVIQDPALNHRLKVSRGVGQRTIAYPDAFSRYEVIDALPGGAHGLNLSLGVVDELHAQKNRELVDVLQTAFGARRQPIFAYITTADFRRESICNEKHKYASGVRDGDIDDARMLPVIFEAEPGDDWTTEETWRKANPNYGVSIHREYLERECLRAQSNPAYENTYKRLHLNIQTEVDTLLINRTVWNACGPRQGEPNDPVQWREWAVQRLAGKRAYAGLDLGYTRDMSALVLDFPPQDGDPLHYVLPFYWVPENTMRERTQNDNVPYHDWTQNRFLWTTPGEVTDFDYIRRDIADKIAPAFEIVEVAFDRYKANQLVQQLISDGLDLVEFAMTASVFNTPVREAVRLTHAQSVNHGANPILAWNAANVAVAEDSNGNMRPDKRKSADQIDGFVAWLMTLGRLAIAKERRSSVYKKRGIISL